MMYMNLIGNRSGRQRPIWLALGLVLVVGVAACGGGSDDEGGIAGNVVISGSSTVEPISVRVAELFEEIEPGVSVTVDGPGTGDGFRLFCDGETDISDASRRIKDVEAARCKENGISYIELKVGIDGLAIISSSADPAAQCLTFHDIYSLVGPESAGFKNWSDAQALAAEIGSSTVFPDRELNIFGPGEESGTFDSFVEIVLEGIAQERGAKATTRPDYTASADDNVIISGVQRSDGSLGWVGLAFAENAPDVRVLEVDGGDGCVAPDASSVATGRYPIARPLYIYVNEASAEESAAISAYVDFYLTVGLEEAVAEVGYVPLGSEAQNETRLVWKGR